MLPALTRGIGASCENYGGSSGPPRELKVKEIVSYAANNHRFAMGDTSSSGGVKESSLLWPMLTRDNYSEWAIMMQCNYEALEI
jgi:hypothetical protein